MRTLILSCLGCALLAIVAIDSRGAEAMIAPPLALPCPQSVKLESGSTPFPSEPTVQAEVAALEPLAGLLASEFTALTGGSLVPLPSSSGTDPFIRLDLDPALGSATYRLRIGATVNLTAGSYSAAAMGTATLLQLLNRDAGGHWSLPLGTDLDTPAAPFRALMIDVARNWHSIASLRQLIELARWYKLDYVQLHLTDDQSCTFPFRAFPRMATPGRHYTEAELKGLVRFAALRGITIIPELEVPGHAAQLIRAYPEIFGFDHPGKSTINLGNLEIYPTLDAMIGELIDVFTTSPYLHLGGDEADLQPLAQEPAVKAALALPRDHLANVQELYRHFLVLLNDIVLSHSKHMLIWEGFGKTGQPAIPTSVTVVEWETAYQLPGDLLAGGYPVINASWKPLYVVNDRVWDPDYIYERWNLYRWENPSKGKPSYFPIQLAPNPGVIGGMMCAWEQTEQLDLVSLRRRVAAFGERVWHGGLGPERPVSWFNAAVDRTDASAGILMAGAANSDR